MASKSMTVSVEAYEALAKLKQDKESFSEVILRVAAPQKTFWDCFGMWTEKEADEVERNIADLRKRWKPTQWQ